MWSRLAKTEGARPDNANAAGFTLLEALVALAVLAGGLGALAGLTGQNVTTTRYAERRVALVAALRKAYVALPPRNATGAEQHGDINGFAWTLNAIPLPGPPGIWAPTAIKLKVGNGSGDVVEIDAVTLRKQAAQ